MKLADAEQLLRSVKEQGPITERWSCLTDEGIMLEAWPLGFARGSLGLQEITMHPHWQRYELFEGQSLTPMPHPRWSPRKMWQQEMFVYLREMREAFAKAFQDFEHAPFFPRSAEVGPQWEVDDSCAPRIEDFTLFPPVPAIGWIVVGEQSLSAQEFADIRQEFCELLRQFAYGEKNGKRTVVRVRSAVSPEAQQGSGGTRGVAEVGDSDCADDDPWD